MFDVESDAVDELKRRARRRLVGAVVLAVAAAILIPALLESESRPLGQDVQIEIPSMSKDGLAAGARDEAPPAAAAAQPGGKAPSSPLASVPGAPAGEAPARPAISASAPASAAASDKPVHAAAQAGSAAASGKPAPAAAQAPSAPAPASASAPAAASVPAEHKAAGRDLAFVVQLAAYSEPRSAQALASQLKTGGYPAYIEALATSHGALTRVRVGPYATREAAEAARVKLNAAGQHGFVEPSH